MSARGPRVAIVGGGLAGLAAASVLCEDAEVTLFEAKRQLGGRAGSFQDPISGELVDHCQHVSMGCCTNLTDFCRRTGIDRHLRRYSTLYFIGPNGTCHSVKASRYLSAPLHLAFALLRLNYLGLRDRLRIARGLLALTARWAREPDDGLTAREWLERHAQSPQAIEQFWDVILVSALGESTRYASIAAARHVLRDGFMASREAFELYVPQIPLGELYGSQLQQWFAARGVQINLSAQVRNLATSSSGGFALTTGADEAESFSHVIVAVPWRRVGELLAEQIKAQLLGVERLNEIEASPISGVHLWFDRPITYLPHAVLVGRLSQWIFARGIRPEQSEMPSHYYQVVISASREIAGHDRSEVIDAVCEELREVFPAARTANLLHGRVVSDPVAVFSVRPGLDAQRPPQRTNVPGLYLAGDWTATGWPATMEGAVRSGYGAAEHMLADLGRPRRIVVPDLKRSLLGRLVLAK